MLIRTRSDQMQICNTVWKGVWGVKGPEKIHFKFYEIFLYGRRVGQSYADWTSHGQGRKNAQLLKKRRH
jgi:hypothetical protein